jgi:hypothetical protein
LGRSKLNIYSLGLTIGAIHGNVNRLFGLDDLSEFANMGKDLSAAELPWDLCEKLASIYQ